MLVDYSGSQLQQAQARLGNLEKYIYVAADIYHLPFVGGVFDAATMIRTLHHMADARREIRLVALEGYFVAALAANEDPGHGVYYRLCRGRFGPRSRVYNIGLSIKSSERGSTRMSTVNGVLPGVNLSDETRTAHPDVVAIQYHKDPSILGGMIIRAGDKLIDGSVATRLQEMRQTLGVAVRE